MGAPLRFFSNSKAWTFHEPNTRCELLQWAWGRRGATWGCAHTGLDWTCRAWGRWRTAGALTDRARPVPRRRHNRLALSSHTAAAETDDEPEFAALAVRGTRLTSLPASPAPARLQLTRRYTGCQARTHGGGSKRGGSDVDAEGGAAAAAQEAAGGSVMMANIEARAQLMQHHPAAILLQREEAYGTDDIESEFSQLFLGCGGYPGPRLRWRSGACATSSSFLCHVRRNQHALGLSLPRGAKARYAHHDAAERLDEAWNDGKYAATADAREYGSAETRKNRG
jgi:hypothetical protein